MKKLFLVILAGGIMFTACKKEEKEILNIYQQKRYEIKNPDFVLIDKNFFSNGCFGELYVNNKNLADTLFVIKKDNE